MDIPVDLELKVAELKVLYGDIYMLEGPDLDGQDLLILVRPLMFSEHLYILDLDVRGGDATAAFMANTIISCYKDGIGFIPTGDIPQGYILEVQNLHLSEGKFDDPNGFMNTLNQWRTACTYMIPVAQCMVLKAFSQYKLSDLDAMNQDQFCRLVAMAECVLQTPLQLQEDNPQGKSEKQILKGIMKEAQVNDKLIDFGADNEALMQ